MLSTSVTLSYCGIRACLSIKHIPYKHEQISRSSFPDRLEYFVIQIKTKTMNLNELKDGYMGRRKRKGA